MLLDKKTVCTDLGVEIKLDKDIEKIQVADKDTDIEFFENAKENNTLFQMNFSTQDSSGNMLAYRGKWTVKMLRIDIESGRDKYDLDLFANDMRKDSYDVKVKNIDYDEKIVYVSHRVVQENSQRNIVIKNMNKKLKDGELVIVPARVIAVSKYKSSKNGKLFSAIYIDLCGLNILGSISIKNWANAFIPNIELEAKKGDIVYVVVLKKKVFNGKTTYICSRRAYHEHIGYNPWDLVGERLKEKMSVKVKVVDRDPGKGTFFASIEGIPYINVLCYNPDGVREVRIGSEWLGYIAKMDVENKYLRVKVLEKISKDKVTEE